MKDGKLGIGLASGGNAAVLRKHPGQERTAGTKKSIAKDQACKEQ